MKKINVIIPARGGSKRIHRKNLANINGKPLLAYTIEVCKLIPNIGRVIVSTDDFEIADISVKYGAEIPFMRPKEYGKDSSPDNGFLKHYFSEILCDETLFLRPTSPFRKPEVIVSAIEKYWKIKDNITGFRSVNPTGDNPYKMFQMTEDNFCFGFFDDFNGIKDYSNLPRQTFPSAYQANGYVDIVKRSTLFNDMSVYGKKIYGFITPKTIDIDLPDDLEMANIYARNL